ncbi:MAG: zinc-binding dehydrogenase, partial [Gemmata sp.]|nr:zinc-binding dehydrogenase [Gemmata sp.]
MIRAAVFDAPGRPLRIETRPRPVLQPGEALVRVALCTICGSDLHTIAGRRQEKTPSVLGHEPVGIVEETHGPLFDVDGEPVGVGDRVVWAVAVSCGACYFCRRDWPQKCESLLKYGHEPLQPHVGPLGGLATHCHLLRGTALVKVPEGLPNEVAAPAGCATATIAAAFRAAGRSMPHCDGGYAVILGLGMLGLTACAWANSIGLSVIACDTNDQRLALASRFGAAHRVKPPELPELVKEITNGRGADLALELSGSPEAARSSWEQLRVGGAAVWVGAVFPTAAVALAPEQLVRRCLTLSGVHNYTPRDLAAAMAFLAANHSQYPLAELVARTFPLTQVNEAIAFAERD